MKISEPQSIDTLPDDVRGRRKSAFRLALEAMEVNQCIRFENVDSKNLSCRVSTIGQRCGKVFTSRRTDEKTLWVGRVS